MNDETLYAFPHKFQSGPNETTVCFGMTLRDFFAAKAMQGLLSGKLTTTDMMVIATECYAMADAMLKTRDQ